MVTGCLKDDKKNLGILDGCAYLYVVWMNERAGRPIQPSAGRGRVSEFLGTGRGQFPKQRFAGKYGIPSGGVFVQQLSGGRAFRERIVSHRAGNGVIWHTDHIGRRGRGGAVALGTGLCSGLPTGRYSHQFWVRYL